MVERLNLSYEVNYWTEECFAPTLLIRKPDGKTFSEMDIFDVIGSYGPWQRRIFFVFFYINVLGMWQNLAITFLAPNVDFWCVEPAAVNRSDQCDVIVNNSTSESVSCTKWEYDTSHYSETIVSEWDLVCKREWMVSLAKSIYMVGYLFSAIVFGQISDWLGRFPTVVMTFVLTCASMLLSVFSSSYYMFLILRFFMAFGRTGLSLVGYVLIMESMGPEHRTEAGIAIQYAFAIAFVTLPLIAWFVRHWIWLQVVLFAPNIPIAFTYKIVPESPRWLLMRGKTKRLEKILTKAASVNKRDLKFNIKELQMLKTQEEGSKEKKATLFDVLKMPKMRNRTFNLLFIWWVNAFMYYSLTYNTNDLAGNPYLNFFISGALEFPSFAMLFWCIKRFGRRPTLVALMMVGGASCAAIVPLPEDLPWLATTFSMLGKFCVTGSFGLLYLYTSELFPTVVRNVSLGTCSMFSRFGSILAPFIKELGRATHPSVPNVLTALLAVISGLLALLLPETMGRKMPDTLQEGEEIADQSVEVRNDVAESDSELAAFDGIGLNSSHPLKTVPLSN